MEQEKIESQKCDELLNLLTELEDAFSYKMSDKQIKVYQKWLKDVPMKDLIKQTEIIILNDLKFPPISRMFYKKAWNEA